MDRSFVYINDQCQLGGLDVMIKHALAPSFVQEGVAIALRELTNSG
jgi:hypothetical protein